MHHNAPHSDNTLRRSVATGPRLAPLCAIVLTFWIGGCGGDTSPDLIVFNGNVLTMDPLIPRAAAFSIRDGRIIEVGDDSTILAEAGPRTKRLDLGDREPSYRASTMPTPTPC